jgi:hypothetical protein
MVVERNSPKNKSLIVSRLKFRVFLIDENYP